MSLERLRHLLDFVDRSRVATWSIDAASESLMSSPDARCPLHLHPLIYNPFEPAWNVLSAQFRWFRCCSLLNPRYGCELVAAIGLGNCYCLCRVTGTAGCRCLLTNFTRPLQSSISMILIHFYSLHSMMMNQFSPNHHFGFEAAAWYWHFVDVFWLFLYFSIYWWGS